MAKVLARDPSGGPALVEVDVGAGITVHFPFFLADGSASNVALTADQMLPFFLADGTASDIALTT